MAETHIRKKSRFDDGDGKSAQDKAREIAARLATSSQQHQQSIASSGESAVTKKVYVPVAQNPDVNFIGLLIGPKGSTHRSLEEQSGTKIKFRGRGSARDGETEIDGDDDLHVLIVGDRDEKVKKAEDMVRAILFDQNSFLDLKRKQLSDLGQDRFNDPSLTVIHINVPRTHIGMVIGKGGENIRDLKDRSGAFIQVEDSKEEDNNEAVLQIRGRKECVDMAESLVKQTLADIEEQIKSRGSYRQMLEVETEVVVDNDKVGLVIGKGGATIKAIQEKYNCRVEIPKVGDAANPLVRTLLVRSSTKEDGEEAKREILKTVIPIDSEGGSMHQTTCSEIFVVPNNKVGLIIGKLGATIKMIQTKTGCDIQIPQEADPGTNNATRSIQLTGTNVQCTAAKSEIEKVLDEYERGSYNLPTTHNANAYSNSIYSDTQAQQLQWQQYYAAQSAGTVIDPTTGMIQKYTREQWNQWREYYAQFGYPMEMEPPQHLLIEKMKQVFRTALTSSVGITHPVVQGGMHYVGYAELASAVSNGGGLGMVTALTLPDAESLRKEIQKCKSMTDKPFGVNLTLLPMLVPPDYEAYARVVVEEGIKVVETAGHYKGLEPFVKLFKDNDIKIIHKCTAVRHAQTAERMGVDMVSIDGFEAAGHPGEQDVPNWVLYAKAAKNLKVPWLACGGSADGRQLAAALAMGASGIAMGTRFMATKEAPIHQNIKQALVDGSETSTTLIMRSMRNTERVFKNKAVEELSAIESQHPGDFSKIKHLIGGRIYRDVFQKTGNIEEGVWSCGVVTGLIDDIPTCEDLIKNIVTEAKSSIDQVNNLIV